jgi:hypothetical protein
VLYFQRGHQLVQVNSFARRVFPAMSVGHLHMRKPLETPPLPAGGRHSELAGRCIISSGDQSMLVISIDL